MKQRLILRCRICDRPLRSKDSRAAGIGPKCAKPKRADDNAQLKLNIKTGKENV